MTVRLLQGFEFNDGTYFLEGASNESLGMIQKQIARTG